LSVRRVVVRLGLAVGFVLSVESVFSAMIATR